MRGEGIILKTAFVSAFIIGLLGGMNQMFGFHFMSTGWMSDNAVSRYEYYMDVTRQWLSPAILFAASYLFGGVIDIKAQLKETVIHVYWRCFLGVAVGYVMGYSYMSYLMGEYGLAFPIIWGILNGLGVGTILFCISFSAVVIKNTLGLETPPLNL